MSDEPELIEFKKQYEESIFDGCHSINKDYERSDMDGLSSTNYPSQNNQH